MGALLLCWLFAPKGSQQAEPKRDAMLHPQRCEASKLSTSQAAVIVAAFVGAMAVQPGVLAQSSASSEIRSLYGWLLQCAEPHHPNPFLVLVGCMPTGPVKQIKSLSGCAMFISPTVTEVRVTSLSRIDCSGQKWARLLSYIVRMRTVIPASQERLIPVGLLGAMLPVSVGSLRGEHLLQTGP